MLKNAYTKVCACVFLIKNISVLATCPPSQTHRYFCAGKSRQQDSKTLRQRGEQSLCDAVDQTEVRQTVRQSDCGLFVVVVVVVVVDIHIVIIHIYIVASRGHI